MRFPAFDYIVVGAGTAGSILASRLAEDRSVRVLLIEQGLPNRSWTTRIPGAVREPFRPGSPYMRWYRSTPQRHLDGRIIEHPRGVGVGGTSLVNGMVYVRGHRLDYDGWERDGATGWNYAAVLPYFKRIESRAEGSDLYRGGDGPIGVRREEKLDPLSAAFLQAGREAGYPATDDINGRQQEGFGRLDMNVDRGLRSSASYAFLEKIRVPPNLTILTTAICTRVLVEGGTAVAVEIRRYGRPETVYAASEIIVAAGAIGSPQLLMLSGIGPADDLKKIGIEPVHDLPGVGKNLQDHLELDLQWETGRGVSLNEMLTSHSMIKLGLQWLLFRRGAAAAGQAKVGAFLRSSPSVGHADVQLMLFPACFDGWKPMRNVNGFRVSAYPTRPTSRGDLRLRSADPFDDPLLDPNYLSTEQDRALLRRCHDILLDTVSQKAFDPYRGRPLPPQPEGSDPDAFIARQSSAGFHLCGTCKMGRDSDDMAVVDPDARVRGIAGLRVADGSIMPNIVSGNSAAAIMMIGDKVSDLIRERHLPPIAVPPMDGSES